MSQYNQGSNQPNRQNETRQNTGNKTRPVTGKPGKPANLGNNRTNHDQFTSGQNYKNNNRGDGC